MKKRMLILSVALLMVASLFTTSVFAISEGSDGTVSVGDTNNFFISPSEQYSITRAQTRLSAGTYIDTISYISPRVEYVMYDKTLTEKELAELSEAMESIDYDNYELITGKDFEVKHIPLKYGYSLDIVSITQNDTLKANTFGTAAVGTVSGSVSAYIRYNTGAVIAQATLYATFSYNGSTVSISSHNISASSNESGYYFNNLSSTPYGGNTTQAFVSGRATANAPGMTLNHSLQVSCDAYGNISTWSGN